MGRPRQRAHFELHQPLGGKADHLAQKVGVGGLLQYTSGEASPDAYFSTSVRRFIISSVIGGFLRSELDDATRP
jgi:hypothetical protein